ncbi:MAG: preprotein translocase subunit YajC [Clostridia bacterium]|nr:preprotein translocase subunit YajC [Clostridia bacterium]
MFYFNLLVEDVQTTGTNWFLWVLIGFMVLFLVYSFISGNKRRKKMAEEQEKRSDIHPGYKVTTIGGIMGVVESVDNDANTFVLKTGTEESPAFIKFDKQAIYTSENPFAQEETASPEAEEVFSEENAEAGESGEEAVETAEEKGEETAETVEEKGE